MPYASQLSSPGLRRNDGWCRHRTLMDRDHRGHRSHGCGGHEMRMPRYPLVVRHHADPSHPPPTLIALGDDAPSCAQFHAYYPVDGFASFTYTLTTRSASPPPIEVDIHIDAELMLPSPTLASIAPMVPGRSRPGRLATTMVRYISSGAPAPMQVPPAT